MTKMSNVSNRNTEITHETAKMSKSNAPEHDDLNSTPLNTRNLTQWAQKAHHNGGNHNQNITIEGRFQITHKTPKMSKASQTITTPKIQGAMSTMSTRIARPQKMSSEEPISRGRVLFILF